ncbi:MAG: RecQ family ATP-dependent DNA helicase [bacterium]
MSVSSGPTPLDVLKNVFGYDAFRPTQKDVIDSVLAGNDTLAIMPTGGGKSLCFQVPALLFDGLTIVVSPLISLMQDQVRQLQAAGVEAVLINSALTQEEYATNQQAVASGRAKLLYVAPETLLQPRTKELLSKVKVSCLTIDEAHCISQWGHDFRPEYRQLAEVRTSFPNAVCIALTATATPRVREDIAQSLNLAKSAQFVASFDRPNLFLKAEEKEGGYDQLMRFIDQVEGTSESCIARPARPPRPSPRARRQGSARSPVSRGPVRRKTPEEPRHVHPR